MNKERATVLLVFLFIGDYAGGFSKTIPDKIQQETVPIKNINNIGNINQDRHSLHFFDCIIVENATCPDENVTFFLFTKEQPDLQVPVIVGPNYLESNLNNTYFDASQPSKIIIHGFNSDMNISVLQAIKDEYLKTDDYNIFAVDWSPLNRFPCYLESLANIHHVGQCTAQLIQRLLDLNNTDIHAIGFSLGAQVLNYISLNLRPYVLPRLTGLDPAGPGFYTSNVDEKLDTTDADFVDVIHTDAFLEGEVESSGHVDFYVNGGAIQPGCENDDLNFISCSHYRAPAYYAESINSEIGFFGWPCPSYFDYLSDKCPPVEPDTLMGAHVEKSARGVHLVITNSTSPYAIGKNEVTSMEIFAK